MAVDRAMGDAPVHSNAFTPDTPDTATEHVKHFRILKAIAFAEMNRRFRTYNHEQRRLITRTLERSGCKVITDNSNIDDEDLD